MKEALTALLARQLPLPGVAAWSARLPDHSLVHQSYSDWFTEDQLDQILGRLTLAVDGLSYHGIQPLRLSWVFEHARIHLSVRPDGPCLAFYVENRTSFSMGKIESLFDEFAALPGGHDASPADPPGK